MRRLALATVVVGFFALISGDTAYSGSVLKDIDRSLHKVERDLCKKFPSPKCRVRKHKPAKSSKPASETAGEAQPKPSTPTPEAKPESKVPPVPANSRHLNQGCAQADTEAG